MSKLIRIASLDAEQIHYLAEQLDPIIPIFAATIKETASGGCIMEDNTKKEARQRKNQERAEKMAGLIRTMYGNLKGSRIGMKAAAVLILFLVYLYGAVVLVKPEYVGVLFSKMGSEPGVEGRFIVEKGEKGYWRETLLPGWHFFWLAQPLWKYKIEQMPMTRIPSQSVGLVEALDGFPMPEGEILAKDDFVDQDGVFHMGQKGPRKTVLKPGIHPINPKYLQVTQVRAVVIPEGKIGVVIRRTGEIPPYGTVLVGNDTSFRGIQREIIPPGTYYFNPLAMKVEQFDATIIQKGQVGVVTMKVGRMPPAGTILVSAESDYQGIQREVLQPGMYYINPYEREVRIVDAVIVPDGFVGVQVAKTGLAKPTEQLLADPGERGILKETLPPGMYYVNPFEFDIIPFDTRDQRYEMTYQTNMGDTKWDDAIYFLSDDGFMIRFDLTVLFNVNAVDTPVIVATIGRDIAAVREKIIRPAARSYARIIGSKNKGEEFIHGETREKFQVDLHEAIMKQCADSKIKVRQTLVRHFEVPADLRDPITKKVIALKLQQQFEQEQETQKANAKLARERELVVFEAERVKAETTKAKAIISAQQQRDEAEIMKAQKQYLAEGDALKKKIDAEAVLYAAQKEAEGIKAVKTAQAEGQRALVNAWSGQGAQNLVASELAKVMNGAVILPLETFFGGGSKGGEGQGPIRYHNTIDLLNYFKIDELISKVRKGEAAADNK